MSEKLYSLNNVSILVIGITKDGGKMLQHNVKKLLKMRKYVQTCDFLIYENNSAQQTKDILKKLKEKINGFDYVSEDLTKDQIEEICQTKTENGKPCRIELITYARNKLQTEAKKRVFDQNGAADKPKYQYILNIDLDVLLFNPLDSLKSLLRFAGTDFDCITGCGMTKWLRYRDAYAFRSSSFPFGPEFMPEHWWDVTWHQIQQRYPKNLKIPVYSAFGGAAVYKSKAYFAAVYNCHPTSPDFLQKHAELVKKSKPSADQIEKASQTPAPNTGYTAPIICEHVPFHYKLIDLGFDKIFVDTSWRFIFKD